MTWYIVKLFITAGIIVLISEVSKRMPLLGSLIASLPLVSVLGILWMYGETRDVMRIASHAEGTFWYVLPSLPILFNIPGAYQLQSPAVTLLPISLSQGKGVLDKSPGL